MKLTKPSILELRSLSLVFDAYSREEEDGRMSSHRVALVAFKLLAVGLLAYAVIGAACMPQIWHTSPSDARDETAAFLALPWLASLGLGVALWFGAGWFASRVFPAGRVDEDAVVSLRTEPVFAVGVSIIGVFLLVQGIPSLASAAYFFGRSLEAGGVGPDESYQRLLWDEEGKATAVAGVTRVLLGLLLLAGPARLAAVASRVRKEFGGSLIEEDKSAQK
jgi:hypothetical protein